MLTLSLLILSLCLVGGAKAQANIVGYAYPDIEVLPGGVKVTVHLQNTGNVISDNNIIELQVLKGDEPWLWISPFQGTCDIRYPRNVHKQFQLNPWEKADVVLESTVSPGTYELRLVTVDKCCVDSWGNPVTPACVETTPYGFGTYIGVVTVTGAGPFEPIIMETSPPTVSVSGSTITTTLHLKNTGSGMTDSWLIETQPRKQHWPLAYIEPEAVCDPNHPENVHRLYNLNAGEAADVTIRNTDMPDGTYYLYAVSVDKCCVDSQGVPVTPACVDQGPYGLYGRHIDTVQVGSGNGNGVDPIMDFLTKYGIYLLVVVTLIIVGVVLMATDRGGKR